jgi:hypothetical protein
MLTNPCCCVDCWIYRDLFDRADDTDLGADWDEVNGTWEIKDNELKCTASGEVTLEPAAIDNSPPHNWNQSFVTGYTFTTRIKAGDDGDIAGFSVGTHVAGQYLFEIEFGTPATCRLYNYNNGSIHAECEVTAPPETWVELRVDAVYSETEDRDGVAAGDTINFSVSIDGVVIFNRTTGAFGVDGLPTLYVDAVSTAVYFDDFYLRENQYWSNRLPEDDDCRADAPYCVWPANYVAEMPATVTVVVTGTGAINGTYVLDKLDGECRYQLNTAIEVIPAFPGTYVIDYILFEYDGIYSFSNVLTTMKVTFHGIGTSPASPARNWAFNLSDPTKLTIGPCGNTIGSYRKFGGSTQSEGTSAICTVTY